MQQIKKLFLTYIILFLTLFLVTACSQFADMDSHSAISRFQKSEDVFRASMRWGEWTNAFQLMRDNPDSDNSTAKLKPPSEEYLVHLDTIKVQYVEVLGSGMDEKEGKGQSRFKIEYNLDNSAVIKSIRYKVSWWYDREGNHWFTDTPLPEEFDLPKSKTIKLSPKR